MHTVRKKQFTDDIVTKSSNIIDNPVNFVSISVAMAAHKKWCVLLFWLLHFSVAIAGRARADAESGGCSLQTQQRPALPRPAGRTGRPENREMHFPGIGIKETFNVVSGRRDPNPI